jgi:hypothetical protein
MKALWRHRDRSRTGYAFAASITLSLADDTLYMMTGAGSPPDTA